MSKIKIALLASEYKKINGGAGIYARTLVKVLKKCKKIDFDIYSCKNPSSFIENIKFIWNLRKIKNNYDIIHNLSFLTFADLLIKSKAKRIATLHSTADSQLLGILRSKTLTFYEIKYLLFYPIIKIIEKIYSKKIDYIISVGRKTKIKHNKIKFIQNAIILPKKIKNPPIKERYVLFIGRFLGQKGIDILKYIAENTKYKIVAIGRGKFENKKIINLGFVKREVLFSLLSKAEAVILPSHNENSPYVCYEAMSLGKPLICFDVGNIREVMKNKCIIAKDKNDFLEKINQNYLNPRKVKYFYDAKKELKRYEKEMVSAYKEVLNENPDNQPSQV